MIKFMVFSIPSATIQAGHLLCRVISELFAITLPSWALSHKTEGICFAVQPKLGHILLQMRPENTASPSIPACALRAIHTENAH